MARLWGSGFELNTTVAEVEWTSFNAGGAITTTQQRSGTYGFDNNNELTHLTYQFASANSAAEYYFRTYFKFDVDSIGEDNLIFFVETTAGGDMVGIRINTLKKLELWNEEATTQIGSDSAALTVDTWYRLELKVNATTIASTNIEARIDGVAFASGTINLTSGIAQLVVGTPSTPTGTVSLLFDDVAINNASGSFQNSWPGEGEIIHLRPNADGDVNNWNNEIGSFADLDEVTPDDDTTDIAEITADVVSEFNIDATPAALASNDTINCVQVGWRGRGSSVGTTPQFVLRIKASAGGTVEESASITHNNTTWSTNAPAVPRNYALTLYDLPGASSTAWTKSDLDTTQIGVRKANNSTQTQEISTLWLSVDHKPATGTMVTNERSAKVHGQQSANDSRSAKLQGVDTTQESRDAKIRGQLTADAERSAKIYGQEIVTSERSGKIHGVDTTTGERSAKIYGQAVVTSERSSKVHGVDTTVSERSAKITGSLPADAERAAKLHGQAFASDTRDTRIHGQDSTSDTRSAKITGTLSANDARSGKIHGMATSTDERAAKVRGSLTGSDERSAKVFGQDSANSSRDAKLHGQAAAPAERDAKIHGTDTATSERSAKINGDAGTSVTDERSAKLQGIATTTDERSAKLHGQLTTSDERPAKIHGTASTTSERAAKLTGQDETSSTRDAKMHGQDTTSAERSVRIHGIDPTWYDTTRPETAYSSVAGATTNWTDVNRPETSWS